MAKAKKPAKTAAIKAASSSKQVDEALLLRTQRALSLKRHVLQKMMFGGMAFFLHGNLLVGLWKGGLIARIGLTQAALALVHPHVSAFQPTSGRPMKGWVFIEGQGLAAPNQLETWIALAVEFVETLPIKPDSEEPLEQWVERSLRFA